MTNYPIKIKSSAASIDELTLCEYGSYEDMQRAVAEGRDYEMIADTHVVDILGRWKTTIEIRDQDELLEFWWCLCSGTFQVDHLRAAQSIADKLYPAIEPLLNNKESVEQKKRFALNYRYPDGS